MCRICNYNQVKDLDRAFLAGVTPAELSRRYAFTVTELERRQGHLQQKMARAQKRFHELLNLGLYCKLNTVMEMALWVVRSARKSEDVKLFLQSSREVARIVGLMDKMAARLQVDPEFIYCLLANSQWDLQEDSHLPSAYQALSQTRQSLKRELFASCPESVPVSLPEITTAPETPPVNPTAIPAEPNSCTVTELSAVRARQTNCTPATGRPSPG
jgi:hypothetical protein